ncbi:leucine--tRNA ligase [Candidatus Campbellbacteria bacterium RIFCSPLOWO2_01_FULL_34_15]|uniref:Leucine--tRNA ligase n=2 Tax=Candidatus Campbelliibacteriota TaxID=1752727 RepID=A0A1F5EN92_9BACT|nr:MAG: leucine--tRNA ligase [Candidatus Campbellbacteria bacterium RIFCSPLOWO2_01_FULL_34_15]OGD69137.1 MAG: leucine--tRNA ligase [Candidatus Campbellbacteria bacterium RIFCSPHIGHO2_01_FULL_34_10]
MNKYNHKEIEQKWQEKWQKDNAFKIDKDDTSKPKYYILDMFPYPSGDGLHMGHTESYTASDVYYRFKKMQGFNVLHPQGFDAFGLPAENYAIKTKVHPAETTEKNINTYIGQMKMLGLAYDFDEKAVTSDPKYYKWTQWIFSQFYKNDLVYKKTSKTNWCSSCQTVIANEQVVDGKCERCGAEIIQKEVPGWFFKITDFADDLITGLEKIDWPEHTKKNQVNWIGKSEGALIEFPISNSQFLIKVFTTRPDTLFGATYMVLAPEHSIIEDLKSKIENYDEVLAYIEKAKNKTEMDRIEAKEKTGVEIKGIRAINLANQEEIPIFIADYVLGGYGTGAIMAVPAHDERDYAFSSKYGLPIKIVIEAKNFQFPISNFQTNSNIEIKNSETELFTDNGKLVNSGQFDGMDSETAKKEITKFVGGEMTTNYRLRDWSISRQRYWGCPIPIVYSPDGEAHLVPEENLPWTLPADVDFVPTGISPLAKSKELKERTEKIFGEGWVPEYDTMDTFVDSSWYFLRYPDPHNEKEFCSETRKKWLPVDLYIGGAEHTYMHLLFARFFVKAMNKIGLVNFDEPFVRLRHQGMVLDGQGKKMSKSKGNVINPNDMVNRFGADSVRTYMLFAAPLEDEVMWNEDNIVGVYRFLEKMWRLSSKVKGGELKVENKIQNLLHKTIKKVSNDIDNLKYNTAVSAMMILINDMEKEEEIARQDYESFLKILSPFAPHITQELWQILGNTNSIHDEPWPKFDENLMKDTSHIVVIQINGKVRAEIQVEEGTSDDDVKKLAMEQEASKKWMAGNEPKKIIYVKNKLVNIVI